MKILRSIQAFLWLSLASVALSGSLCNKANVACPDADVISEGCVSLPSDAWYSSELEGEFFVSKFESLCYLRCKVTTCICVVYFAGNGSSVQILAFWLHQFPSFMVISKSTDDTCLLLYEESLVKTGNLHFSSFASNVALQKRAYSSGAYSAYQ